MTAAALGRTLPLLVVVVLVTTGCRAVGWVEQRTHEAGIEPVGDVVEVAAGRVGDGGWRFVTYVSSEGETTRWYRDGVADGTAWNLTGLERPGRHLSVEGGAWCGDDVVRTSAQVTHAVSVVEVVADGEVVEELTPVRRAADAPWALVATVVEGTDRTVELVARSPEEELDRETAWVGHGGAC